MYICTQCNHIFEEGEGKIAVDVWAVIDELMETVKYLQPRIYQQVINRIKNI